jgi:hypothetical protein
MGCDSSEVFGETTVFGNNFSIVPTRECVCFIMGNFQYFITENGLSDTQVRSIYEDENGIICFECGKGTK